MMSTLTHLRLKVLLQQTKEQTRKIMVEQMMIMHVTFKYLTTSLFRGQNPFMKHIDGKQIATTCTVCAVAFESLVAGFFFFFLKEINTNCFKKNKRKIPGGRLVFLHCLFFFFF